MKLEMQPNGILCAIDVNDFDQEVIDLAAEFAKQFGVDLDLLHVTLFPDPNNAAWPAGLGSTDSVIADNRQLRKLGTNVSGVNVIHHQLTGTPSEKILKFADRNNPRMLVLGTHGRRGLARVFGSVASNIMRHANCPVMVMRQNIEKKPNPKETQPDRDRLVTDCHPEQTEG